MENEITHEHIIKCRKCNGPHLTIKCGREKKDSLQEIPEKKDSLQDKHEKKDYVKKKDYGEKRFFKVTYRVKLSELPTDMTENELYRLTTDWGHIVKIKLLIYNESSCAYIDFGYENEANYFVESIDKTPFEYKLLFASRVDSTRRDKPLTTLV
jgi:hypothetical protein